jgi:hypothetical protein
MKKLSIAITVILLVVIAAYAGLMVISQKLDAEAENAISLYELKLNKYKVLNGKYPESLHEVNITRKNPLFLIKPSPIKYTRNEFVELYYIQFPLGPKRVYNLSNKAWRFEE